jgi:uncharacterized protein (TIGR02271 family)
MADEFTVGNLRKLSDVDFTVADNEPDIRGWTVVSMEGAEIGDVDDLIIDTDAMKVRYLELDADSAGQEDVCYVPIDAVDLDHDRKRVMLRQDLAAFRRRMPDDFSASIGRSTAAGSAAESRRLTRSEEEVHVGKREVQAGEVRIGKHVESEHRRENVDIMRDEVRVERRPATGAAPGEIRGAGDEIRVPIVEEEVVVEKRPVVKEELIVSKERVRDTRPVDVEVRKEEFDIHDDRRGPHDEVTGKPRRGGNNG